MLTISNKIFELVSFQVHSWRSQRFFLWFSLCDWIKLFFYEFTYLKKQCIVSTSFIFSLFFTYSTTIYVFIHNTCICSHIYFCIYMYMYAVCCMYFYWLFLGSIWLYVQLIPVLTYTLITIIYLISLIKLSPDEEK